MNKKMTVIAAIGSALGIAITTGCGALAVKRLFDVVDVMLPQIFMMEDDRETAIQAEVDRRFVGIVEHYYD